MLFAVFSLFIGTFFEEKITHPCCGYGVVGDRPEKITGKAKERDTISQILCIFYIWIQGVFPDFEMCR